MAAPPIALPIEARSASTSPNFSHVTTSSDGPSSVDEEESDASVADPFAAFSTEGVSVAAGVLAGTATSTPHRQQQQQQRATASSSDSDEERDHRRDRNRLRSESTPSAVRSSTKSGRKSDRERRNGSNKRSAAKEAPIASPNVAPADILFTPSGLAHPSPASDSVSSTRSFSSPTAACTPSRPYVDLSARCSEAEARSAARDRERTEALANATSGLSGTKGGKHTSPPKYDTFGETARSDIMPHTIQTEDLGSWLSHHGFGDEGVVEGKLTTAGYSTLRDLIPVTKIQLKGLLGVKDGIRLYHLIREVEASSLGTPSIGSRPRILASSFLPPTSPTSFARGDQVNAREVYQPGLCGHCSYGECDLPAIAVCAAKKCERTLCTFHSSKNLLTANILCEQCYDKQSLSENVLEALGYTKMKEQGYNLECAIQ